MLAYGPKKMHAQRKAPSTESKLTAQTWQVYEISAEKNAKMREHADLPFTKT